MEGVLNREIESLKKELADLKSQIDSKSAMLANKIEALEARANANPQQQAEFDTVQPSYKRVASPQAKHETTNVKPKEKRPSFIEKAFSHVMAFLFEWFDPITAIYKNYQARGMLGIFLLTLSGVVLVLAGFAYLMQLVIDELGAGSKSALLGSSAVAVVVGGLYLKVKTKYAEYASAIVGLGLLLCFITIYFVGSVYSLLPALVTLGVYALIAFSCHYLALYLETKVVAAMGIVGITLIPLIADASTIAPGFYLLAVFLVSVSSLYLAYRYLGQWLSNLTFVFCFISLGWISSNANIEMAAWMINAFYVQFFCYLIFCLYQQGGQTQKVTHRLMLCLAANFGASLLLLLQSEQFSFVELSFQFSLNAVISFLVAYALFRERHQYTYLAMVIGAAWLVLTIVALLSERYWGIAWAIEGLLLIYMSQRYGLAKLLHHGQALCAIAIGYCALAIYPYFPSPALLSTDGWLIVFVIAASISIWRRLIANADPTSNIKLVYPTLIFVEAAWLSTLALSCAYIWLGLWAGLSAIIVQLAILFRARQTSHAQLELLAAALILFPLAYTLNGANQVDAFSFSLLPLFAKLSLILAFTQLWLWSAFYRKFYPTSQFAGVSELARLAFYFLLPICWIGSAFRFLEDDIFIVLWLSPMLSLLLAYWVKSSLIAKQSKVLCVLLVILTLFKLMLSEGYISGLRNWLSDTISIVGLIILVATAFYLPQKDLQQNSACRFIQSTIVNFAAIVLAFFFAGSITHSFVLQDQIIFVQLIPLLLITAYSLWALADSARFEVFARNSRFHQIVLSLITLCSWFLLANGSQSNWHFVLYPCLILVGVAYSLVTHASSREQNLSALHALTQTKNADLIAHSYAVVTYLLFFAHMSYLNFDLAIAPVLAAHGAAILFLKNRRVQTVRYSFALILIGIAKLALIDAAQVVLWQKVILFIGIGAFILFASFWYQKLVAKDRQHA